MSFLYLNKILDLEQQKLMINVHTFFNQLEAYGSSRIEELEEMNEGWEVKNGKW